MSIVNSVGSIDFSSMNENILINMERDYKAQIYSLERELIEQPKKIESLCEWIDCYHKLSEIFQLQEDYERAQKCLFIPYQSMLYMAQYYNGDEEKALIARKALNLTLPPLLVFSEQYPPCQNCLSKLKLQQSLLEEENKNTH